MLVLSRKLNDSVRLYDESGALLGEVTVVAIVQGKIRLGFKFALNINIVRSEIDTHARSTSDVTTQSGG